MAEPVNRVAVKVANVVTEYTLDNFFSNAGTSPKQTFNATGALVWSPHNMCLRSQEFDQATPWNPTTQVTVTANATTAPDATSTADRLVETAISGNHQLACASITSIAGATYTFSVYAKAGERGWLSLQRANEAPTNFFDLTNGVLGNTVDGGAISAAGGGWHRCSITWVAAGAGVTPNIFIRTANAQNGVYTGDISKGLYIWGAQLNRGSTPLPYLPTTSAARYGLALDYDPVTHAPRGLLCEPAATNVQASSVDGTNATYWALTGTTAARGGIAPNGQAEATTLTETIATSIHYMFAAASGRPTLTAVPYTFSVYLKAGTRRYVTIAAQASSSGFYVTVDTQAWTITNSANMGTGWTYASSSLQNVGNGWYRVSITGTPAATGLIFVIQGSTTSTGAFSESYLGDGSTIIWWGIQVETGTVATSPIPTYASVTRAADNYNFLLSAIPALGSQYSVYCRFSGPVANTGRYVFALTEGVGNEVVGVQTASVLSFYVIDGGALLGQMAMPILVANTPTSVALRVKLNDCAVSKDGATVVTDTAVTVPTPTEVRFANANTAAASTATNRIEKLVIVPGAWDNAKLQAKAAP